MVFVCFSSILGIIAWIVCYVIMGETASPGGRLFGFVILTVAANFGGFLISLASFPRLIGMLITGILFQVSDQQKKKRIEILYFLHKKFVLNANKKI